MAPWSRNLNNYNPFQRPPGGMINLRFAKASIPFLLVLGPSYIPAETAKTKKTSTARWWTTFKRKIHPCRRTKTQNSQARARAAAKSVDPSLQVCQSRPGKWYRKAHIGIFKLEMSAVTTWIQLKKSSSKIIRGRRSNRKLRLGSRFQTLSVMLVRRCRARFSTVWIRLILYKASKKTKS